MFFVTMICQFHLLKSGLASNCAVSLPLITHFIRFVCRENVAIMSRNRVANPSTTRNTQAKEEDKPGQTINKYCITFMT